MNSPPFPPPLLGGGDVVERLLIVGEAQADQENAALGECAEVLAVAEDGEVAPGPLESAVVLAGDGAHKGPGAVDPFEVFGGPLRDGGGSSGALGEQLVIGRWWRRRVSGDGYVESASSANFFQLK